MSLTSILTTRRNSTLVIYISSNNVIDIAPCYPAKRYRLWYTIAAIMPLTSILATWQNSTAYDRHQQQLCHWHRFILPGKTLLLMICISNNNVIDIASKDSYRLVHSPSTARVLIYPSLDSLEAGEDACNQRRRWSDCTDAQVDLGLPWSHKSYCRSGPDVAVKTTHPSTWAYIRPRQEVPAWSDYPWLFKAFWLYPHERLMMKLDITA